MISSSSSNKVFEGLVASGLLDFTNSEFSKTLRDVFDKYEDFSLSEL